MTNLIERKDKSSLSWLSYPHGAMFLENRDRVFADLHLIHEWEVGLVYTEINKLNSSSLRPGHPATFRLFSQVPKQRYSLFMHRALLLRSSGFRVKWTEWVNGKTRCIWASESLWKKMGHWFSPFTLPWVPSTSHAWGGWGMCSLSRSSQTVTHVSRSEAGRRCAIADRQVCEAKQRFQWRGGFWKQLLGLP